MRLAKWLAEQGIVSRRGAEAWIVAGRLKINGEIAKLGAQITPEDKITLDGKKIQAQAPSSQIRLLMYHKPEGEICSRVGNGRTTVFERLPPLDVGRWIMIGRLDLNSSGLLLFTNQGDFANQLMHPSHGIERAYAVRFIGTLTPHAIARLKKGIMLEDGLAKMKSVELKDSAKGANQWCEVVLTEGKNREVRRLFEAVNCTVSRLMRVRYGSLSLPRSLNKGDFVEISEKQIKTHFRQLQKTSP